MPQLPSDRYVAISPVPLTNLLREAEQPGNIHKVMAMKAIADVSRYLDVMFMAPAEQAGSERLDGPMRSDSLPVPQGLVQVQSGFRLSDWDALTSDWSEADKAAMQDFLEIRAVRFFGDCLKSVEETQEALRGSGQFLTRVLVGWWDAGCHPAQEEGWAESDVGSLEWDDYDMLAALGQTCAQLPQRRALMEQWQAKARLQAFWNICRSELPQLANWPAADKPVRECANEARNAGLLNSLEKDKRRWLHDQAIAECMQLWSALGDGFRAALPQPYGIVELVVLSPEANSLLNMRNLVDGMQNNEKRLRH